MCLLMLVTSASLHLVLCWFLSGTINGIKHELQVALGHVRAAGYVGNDRDAWSVFEPVGKI